MVSFELTVAASLTWKWFDENIHGGGTQMTDFLAKISHVMEEMLRERDERSFTMCDLLAAACLMAPHIIKVNLIMRIVF